MRASLVAAVPPPRNYLETDPEDDVTMCARASLGRASRTTWHDSALRRPRQFMVRVAFSRHDDGDDDDRRREWRGAR